MTAPARLLLLVIAALGVHVTAAEALKFDVLPTADGRGVLLIWDCGKLWKDYQSGADGKLVPDKDGRPVAVCQPWETMFRGEGRFEVTGGRTVNYIGDAATLRSYLEKARPAFAEIWLVSGGGEVQAGIAMGRLLRAYKTTVRVPDQKRLESASSEPRLRQGSLVSCVSSCTIAFMGGMFRYKDDAASYQVHSASGVSEGIEDEDRKKLEAGDIDSIAKLSFLRARYSARQLFTHFQNALLLYTRFPQRLESDDTFIQEASDTRGVSIPYAAAQKEKDLQRIRSEGVDAAGQDILMRIERDSMQAAIDELRLRVPSLGPRAEPALKMLEAMYDVGILATQSLSRQAMLSMGYLTRDASTAP